MAPLATTIESLDKVAEPLRGFYAEKDGKFHLQVEGGIASPSDLALSNSKLVEFRDNNIKLVKELDELRPLKTKFEGIDPEVAKADRARVTELEKKGVKGGDDLDAKFKQMLTDAIKPVHEALALSKAETAAERKRADESLLRSVIGGAFTKAGGKGKALDYAIGKALESFEVKDGKVVAQGTKFSAEHPGDPLGVDEWMKGLAKEHDFAFEPSKGSGAAGGNGGGPVTAGLRPGQTLLKDPTPSQLGEFATDILKGKIKVVYSDAQA